jgi:hypothetical protein
LDDVLAGPRHIGPVVTAMPTIPPAPETKQRRLLLEIGRAVDTFLKSENAGRSFVLLLFDPAKPNDPPSGYLSNAKREAATEVMKAQLARFEAAS